MNHTPSGAVSGVAVASSQRHTQNGVCDRSLAAPAKFHSARLALNSASGIASAPVRRRAKTATSSCPAHANSATYPLADILGPRIAARLPALGRVLSVKGE